VIEAYWADSVVPDRRDWRNMMLDWTLAEPPPDATLPSEVATGIIWQSEPVPEVGQDRYSFTMDNPEEGYRAFYIKMVFDASGGDDFFFTTEAHVIPDEFPYEECQTNQECFGKLL